MGDNKGQTIFLSVIGVATLLVAIIGATFAYFTTTVKGAGEGGSLSGTTAKISGTTLTFDANTKQSHDYLAYPGGLAVFGTVASFKKDDPLDKNDYLTTFNLEIEYTNPATTDLKWTLYMLENSPISGDVEAADESAIDPDCKLKTKVNEDETYLWYADQSDSNEDLSGTCSFSEAAQAHFETTNKIASGTLANGTAVATKINSKNITGLDAAYTANNPLVGRQLDSKETTTKYYYLVVEYPNSGDQTADAKGGEISVALRVEDKSITVDQGYITEE